LKIQGEQKKELLEATALGRLGDGKMNNDHGMSIYRFYHGDIHWWFGTMDF
jgi:hypothetical protein